MYGGGGGGGVGGECCKGWLPVWPPKPRVWDKVYNP